MNSHQWVEADYLDTIELIDGWPVDFAKEFKTWLDSLALPPNEKNLLWHRLSDLQRQKVKELLALNSPKASR